MPCLTIADLNKLRPCAGDGRRVRALLHKLNTDTEHCFTAVEARQAGCTFSDIVWAAVSLNDKAVERKLRHWMADCAARVLHIYECDYPNDMRPRDAIKAARAYADGKISATARDAAWDAARDAAWDAMAAARAAARDAARAAARAAAWTAARAAARTAASHAAWAAARDAAWAAWAAEEAWQFDRLILWLSDDEPKLLRLPARRKAVEQSKEREAA